MATTATARKTLEAGSGDGGHPNVAGERSEIDFKTFALVSEMGAEVQRTRPPAAPPPGVQAIATVTAPPSPVTESRSSLCGGFGRHPYLPSESGARHRVEPMARSSL